MLSCYLFYHILLFLYLYMLLSVCKLLFCLSNHSVSAQCTGHFLFECLLVRDGSLKLPVCFLDSDIGDIIMHLRRS